MVQNYQQQTDRNFMSTSPPACKAVGLENENILGFMGDEIDQTRFLIPEQYLEEF